MSTDADTLPGLTLDDLYPRARADQYDTRGTVALPPGVLALDIGTGDADRLFATGPEFIRLVGWQTGNRIRISPDPRELADQISRARLIIGHNVLGFDLLAYARHHGISPVGLVNAGRVFDTKCVLETTAPA